MSFLFNVWNNHNAIELRRVLCIIFGIILIALKVFFIILYPYGKHIPHPQNRCDTTAEVAMVFVPLCEACAFCAIFGVNLHDARTQPVVMVGVDSKMLAQVADLASTESVLKVIHLKDVLCLAPCFLEAHVAPNAEQRRTATSVVATRAATLGLGHPHNVNLQPNQIWVHHKPTRLHHIQNGVNVLMLVDLLAM